MRTKPRDVMCEVLGLLMAVDQQYTAIEAALSQGILLTPTGPLRNGLTTVNIETTLARQKLRAIRDNLDQEIGT